MKYDEIITHPHYEPKNHPRMAREKRAGQFSPFAALSGFDKVIRFTEKKFELRNRRVVDMGERDDEFLADFDES